MTSSLSSSMRQRQAPASRADFQELLDEGEQQARTTSLAVRLADQSLRPAIVVYTTLGSLSHRHCPSVEAAAERAVTL